ncbi:unnamed protein product [Scytosiphon promiscuus]
MAPSDHDVLVALYHATGRSEWRRGTKWNPRTELSEWYGVDVDGGRVVKLRAGSENILGFIPPELGHLTALEFLRLEGNLLYGSIPESLGKLGNLLELSLFWNRLSGPIPKELGALTKLQHLSLTNNRLTGPIPKELGALTELRQLSLFSNRLTGHIPKELGGLRNLESVGLQGNQLSGPIPTELGGLSKLKGLWLNSNKLTGAIPKEFGALTTLKQLSLADNQLTGFAPAQLVKLDRLHQLDLGGNQLSGPVPSLDQLKDLRRALRSPSFTVQDVEGIKRRTSAVASRKLVPEVGEGPAKSGTRTYSVVGATDKAAGDDLVTGTRNKMATVSDFEGDVVAWSFGRRRECLRGRDACFELEVPDLGRNVPAIIGVSSGSAQVVAGKQCLLHPIVTCLAQEGEAFDPPLRLRFPVGVVDAMESGSDCGTSTDAESAYLAYVGSTFSTWTREDSNSDWVPIDAVINKAEGGVFVLEVTVSHFCDFALKQNIEVSIGGVEPVELPRLKHKSRRGRYHFVNLGAETLVIHCWGAARKRSFLQSFKVKLSLGLTSGGVETTGRRTLVDTPDTGLETVQVPGKPEGEPGKVVFLEADGKESLTVVHTTQETVRSLMGSTHTLVQVWGRRSMRHKHAIVFGPLTGAERIVSNLRVEDGVDVGKVVKSTVG